MDQSLKSKVHLHESYKYFETHTRAVEISHNVMPVTDYVVDREKDKNQIIS